MVSRKENPIGFLSDLRAINLLTEELFAIKTDPLSLFMEKQNNEPANLEQLNQSKIVLVQYTIILSYWFQKTIFFLRQ